MATNLSVGERAEAGERFRQLARAGLPFNPLAQTEVAGANLKRLQTGMKVVGWTDPRFVAMEQADALGWTVRAGAESVQILVRDEQSGEVNNVALFNAADVAGIPPLEAMVAMSSEEVAHMRAQADVGTFGAPEFASAVAQGDGAIAPAVASPVIAAAMPIMSVLHEEPNTELDEDFSIGPARSLMRGSGDVVLDGYPALEGGAKRPEAEIAGPAPVETDLVPPTKSESAIGETAKQNPERYAVQAAYWLNGLHNTKGIALASEINASIVALKLAEDRAAIQRLLEVQENAKQLGLSIVPEDLHRNDPSRVANPAEPRTLLGGALVRDKQGAYRPAAGGRAVLVDNGDSVALKSRNSAGYQAAMELALAKGWTAIELKGKPAMLADAWLEAKLRGLDVVNYAPTKLDLAKYGQRLAAERARDAAAQTKPIEPAPEMVEVRPFVDAHGMTKTATVVYTVSHTGSKPQTFETPKDAAAAFGALPSASDPVVIRSVTRADGEVREDIVAGVSDARSGRDGGPIESVVDHEFEMAMMDVIAEEKAVASLAPSAAVEGGKRHIGQILEVQDGRISQSIGRGEVVWHDIADLEGPLPAIGELADIRYDNGIGRVQPQRTEHALDAGRGR